MGRGDLQLQDLRVVMLLAGARKPLTTKDIADKLGIELRTVQRIIKVIEDIPLPLKRDPGSMGGGIRLLGDFALKVSLPSNLVELAAVLVARDKMRESAAGTLLGEAFEQFADRVQQQLKGEQRAITERFVKMYGSKKSAAPAHASPIARIVHKAIDESRVLAIAYTSPKEKKPKRREIEPLGMWVADQRTYVVAHDRQKNALRTFALDRIGDAEVLDQTFTPRADFDPADYFAHAVSAFVGGGPVALRLALDAEAVRRIGGKVPNDATLTKTKDGATLDWPVPLSDELLAWMVTLGPGVVVEAPKEAIAFVESAWSSRTEAQRKRTQLKRTAP